MISSPNEEIEKFLLRCEAEVEFHSGRSLLAHLIGTFLLLKEWNGSNDLCLAGLFHSIYGTTKYRRNNIPTRQILSKLIGLKPETLVYQYSRYSLGMILEILCKRNDDGIADEVLDLFSLCELHVANLLEQVPHLPTHSVPPFKKSLMESKTTLEPYLSPLARSALHDFLEKDVIKNL